MKDDHFSAEIIAVGSELLTESKLETNSLFVTARLYSLGISVARKTVVGDQPAVLSRTLQDAINLVPLVILTGGLGPTSDDLTRETVAQALDRPLHLDPQILAHLQTLYQRFGFEMSENNRRQAQVPEGAEVLPNPKGTAPGLFLTHDGCLIFLLPGPPRELQPMMDNQVVPRLTKLLPTRRRFSRQLRVASMAESAVDQIVEPIYRSYPDVETTILSSLGIIDLLFKWRGADNEASASAQLDRLVKQVRQELGAAVFSEGPEELEALVGRLLRQRGLRLAAAESCTGGLISKMLTDVPGSSEYFLGGVIAYSNSLKMKLLHVNDETLQQYGAVSVETAREMAQGVCRLTGAEVGLAVTGIAGPEGGSADKPVGTVCFGLCLEGRVAGKQRRLPGDRLAVRERSARFALDWVRRKLS